MATTLNLYLTHIHYENQAGMETLYALDGIDGLKKVKTEGEIEKIVDNFIKSKNDLELGIYSHLPDCQVKHATKLITKPKGKVVVFEILTENEFPESLKKYYVLHPSQISSDDIASPTLPN